MSAGGTGVDDPDTEPRLSIGAIAKLAEVSTRTLRYYQEVGLISPSGASPGGNRRYSEADVVRLRRVLELRNVMGFDLDRIRVILSAEDRLGDLRREARVGVTRRRRAEMLAEAAAINDRLLEQVDDRLAVLHGFADELHEKRARYQALAEELGTTLPG